MALRYADRAFVSVNGQRLQDLSRVGLKRNFNAKPVPSMTPNRRNRGFVGGNVDYDISADLSVVNTLARAKLDSIDYEGNDVSMTLQFGADIYVAKGLFIKDSGDDASGVGSEVKNSLTWGALDLTDTVGNSILFKGI